MERITMKKLESTCRAMNQGILKDNPFGVKVDRAGQHDFMLHTLPRNVARTCLHEVLTIGSAREVWLAAKAIEACFQTLRRAQ